MATKREPFVVELEGATYQVGGITPRKAFHVFRKLLPFLGALGPVIKRLFGEKTFEELQEGAAKAAGTAEGPESAPAAPELPEGDELLDMGVEAGLLVSRALADMTEADADFVLDNLLAGVRLLVGGVAVPIVENGKLKAETLSWTTQLRLAAESGRFNFGDFLDGLPSGLKDGARTLASRSLG